MDAMMAGITGASEGVRGISWNILGQTYVPKSVSEHSFSWHATFPPETFVPPHIHPDQDEYLYILEGQLDFFLGDQEWSLGDALEVEPDCVLAIYTFRNPRTSCTYNHSGPFRCLH